MSAVAGTIIRKTGRDLIDIFNLMKTIAIPFIFFICVNGYGQHKTYRTDVFTCGTKAVPTSYYLFADQDLNKLYNLLPGDTIAIKIGTNGENYISSIDLGPGTSDGLTLIPDTSNKKEVEIGWLGLGGKATNWTINGKTKYLKRGFLFTDQNHFGLSMECTGNVEVGNCHINGCLIGMQLVTVTGKTYPLNYQRLYSHDNLFENTLNEAEYLGYVHDAPINMDIRVERDTILNAGRDGIQTRNSDTVFISDCYLSGIGLNNEDGQNHGILFGSNSKGGKVSNCILKGVTGVGIWNGGWGDFVYENNVIQAKVAGVMSRSAFPEGDVQHVNHQTQVIKNNKITASKSIECYYTESRKRTSVDIENNCATGTINIDTSITKTLLNNSTCLPTSGK